MLRLDMITATPRQLTCQTTDVVTGWINGFHFWDGAGNKLSSHPSPLSNANDTVRINNIPYPWRKITELPTAIGDVRSCISMDAPWAAYDHTNAGMMAKSIKKGIPEGYKQAIHNAGFILPPIVGDGDHSILSPEPVWLTHWKEGGDVCCLPSSFSTISRPKELSKEHLLTKLCKSRLVHAVLTQIGLLADRTFQLRRQLLGSQNSVVVYCRQGISTSHQRW